MKTRSHFLIWLNILLLTFASYVSADTYAQWTEFSGDPIYNPYPTTLPDDYYPSVIYNQMQFSGHGASFLYKMWHQGNSQTGSIALSYSNDGINWVLAGNTNLTSYAFHPCVVYDATGFGGGPYFYKMWYWIGIPSTSIIAIQFTQSTDGLTWTTPVPVSQDANSPLVDGITPGFFYHLYGPGFVLFNSSALSIPGQPYTFPYVMFYDTLSEGMGPGNSMRQIALAYSNDGLNWTRFGSAPLLIPSGNSTDWDGTHMFRPSLIFVQDTYHLYYSGSNQVNPITTVVPSAQGLGHATSPDGIKWTLDEDNPIFNFSNNVAWRNTRSYTPFVLYSPFCNNGSCPTCFAKMWFTGGSGVVAGQNQGIGYATLPCLPLSPPEPPSHFVGMIKKNKFLNKSELILKAKWKPSPSSGIKFYRIFKKRKVVEEISARDPLVFTSCVPSKHFAKGYSIAAVSNNNSESAHIPIRIIHEKDFD